MAVASGLGDSFGLATEPTFGTYATITRWHEVEAAPFKKNKRIVQGGGLSGGVLSPRGARRVLVGEDASGSLSMEVVDKKMGLLLSHCTGTVATGTVTGSGFTYDFPIVDNIGRYFSGQFVIIDTTGTPRPYTGLGCKVTAFELSCDMNGILMLSVEIDGKQVSEAQSAVAVAITQGLAPFHWAQFFPSFGGTVTSGIVATGTAVSGVQGMSVRFERPQATDRFNAGGAGLKSEPLMNGKWNVTGSFTMEFADKTQIVDRFQTDTSTSLLLPFIGTTQISAAVFPTLAIHLPQVFFDEAQPEISGPDVNSSTVNFTATYDGANSHALIRSVSTDAAL